MFSQIGTDVFRKYLTESIFFHLQEIQEKKKNKKTERRNNEDDRRGRAERGRRREGKEREGKGREGKEKTICLFLNFMHIPNKLTLALRQFGDGARGYEFFDIVGVME